MKTIGRCLSKIFNDSYSNKEVIVIDGLSMDKTVEIAKNFQVKVYVNGGKGIAYARDMGLRVAKGHFIAYCDADKEIMKDWIKKMLECFSDPKVGGAVDVLISRRGDFLSQVSNGYHVALSYVHKSFRRLLKLESIRTGNSMWRRTVLEKVGGFDFRFSKCAEDTDLSYRASKAGWRLFINELCRSYHELHLGGWRATFLIYHNRVKNTKQLLFKKHKKRFLNPFESFFILFIGILCSPKIFSITRSIKATLFWPLFYIFIKEVTLLSHF